MGLDLSTALNIFLAKAVRSKSIPFDVAYEDETPNAEALATIKETYEHPERLEGPYTTVEEALEALHA